MGKVLRVQLCWLKLTHGLRIVHFTCIFDGLLNGKSAVSDIYINVFSASERMVAPPSCSEVRKRNGFGLGFSTKGFVPLFSVNCPLIATNGCLSCGHLSNGMSA